MCAPGGGGGGGGQLSAFQNTMLGLQHSWLYILASYAMLCSNKKLVMFMCKNTALPQSDWYVSADQAKTTLISLVLLDYHLLESAFRLTQ